MSEMIRATGLVKRYKEVEALKGLDLSVPEGKVLALLGPNGADNETAVRILATLIQPDGESRGRRVDVLKEPAGVPRAEIGLSGQYAAVGRQAPDGYENLEMVESACGLARRGPTNRARELLERVRPEHEPTSHEDLYSGGMRRTRLRGLV